MKSIISRVGPFIRNKLKTKDMMFDVLLVLLPIILFAFYKNGILPYINHRTNFIGLIYPLLFILIPLITSIIIETLYNLIINKKDIASIFTRLNKDFAYLPGIFVGLILPINTPILILILAATIATLSKMILGGFGKNKLNPALCGAIIVLLFFQSSITNGVYNQLELDSKSTATPLTNLKTSGHIASYDKIVKPYTNLSNIAIGNIPGTLGETNKILIIVAMLYLMIRKVIKWRITVTCLVTVYVITAIIGLTNNLTLWYPLFHILTGGLLFGATFMATDPVTSPVLPISQIFYGILLGILTLIFRFLSPYPEGVLLSILIMNLMIPLLDNLFSGYKRDKNKVILPSIILILIIIFTTLYITFNVNNKTTEQDFIIINKTSINNDIKYHVKHKGYNGYIEAEIILNNNGVKSYNVIKTNDDRMRTVNNANYLDKLINNKDIDTISGVTITTHALKDMLNKTIEDYKKDNKFNYEIKKDDIVETIPEENIEGFTIISKEKNNDVITYITTIEGFSGVNKAKIEIKNNKVFSYTLLECNDSYCKRIPKDYTPTIATKYNNEEKIDAINGVTITSDSLKKMLEYVMKDYKKGE